MDWNKKPLLQRIIDRWSEKDGEYNRVNRNRQSITRYFRSDEIVDTNDKGQLVGQNIYNGSGSWYSRMMATGFQGALVSKNIAWIRYQMEQFELKGVDELDVWVQDIKEHLSDAYQKSNFYGLQPQFTHDGVTTGSPVMFGEEEILSQRTMWMPQHYSKVRLYYNKYNEVEGCIIRDDTWTAKQIVETFAKNDDKVGTKRKEKFSISINKTYESGSLEEVFTVYRATFKVTDPMWDGEDENKFKKPFGNWKWLSVYFLDLTDNDKKNTPLNDNIGYFSQPFAVWNFDKKPWEISSRTPAWYAIWDCLSLQQIDKNFHENMQLKNRPPTLSLDTMKNRLELSPEGRMYATSKAEYESPPKVIDMIGDINLNKEMVEIKVEALKRWFYIDQFQMFTDLTRTNKAPVATVQIWQMAGEKATLLSPAIETHSTYLEIADARMMDIEIQAGRGPFAPDVMANITDVIMSTLGKPVSKVSVKPVFIGSLAQAQKRSQAIQPIQSTLEAVGPLFEIFPQAALMYRQYETVNDINEALDFPQKNIVPKDEWEEMVRADNEAKEQQQQQLMAIEAAKAAKGLSGPVDETSVLASVAGGAG